MMLVLLGRHFQNTSQKILIITCSIRSKVLGEVGSKVMRVESKEGRHTHESIILKYRPEAKGPKEISYELIFIHDSISIEWISKSLRVSLDRTMPNLWTETHEEGWTRKEVLKKSFSYPKGITKRIPPLLLLPLLLLFSSFLLSLFLFFLLLVLMMMRANFIYSMQIWLSV